MRLGELGEFGMIARVSENTIYNRETLIQGIGDDAAVMRTVPGMVQLATADMLVEDVHFLRNAITPWQLGYKALAVNVSDIAAMGGCPRHALISIGLPEDTSMEYIEELYSGMKYLAAQYGINIVGGDTVASPKGLVINVTLLGECEEDRVVYRSGAKLGDRIVVSGMLGDSAAGLQIVLEDLETPHKEQLLRAHYTPQPQVAIGRVCSAVKVHAMNDISDGLASEVHEICSASQVGALLYEDAIPVSEALRSFAAAVGKPTAEYALFGGEDYQLVFTAPDDQLASIREQLPDMCFSVVGEIIAPDEGIMIRSLDYTKHILQARGYNHFRKGAGA